MEQKQPLQEMVLGYLDSYVQKNETRSPTYASLFQGKRVKIGVHGTLFCILCLGSSTSVNK